MKKIILPIALLLMCALLLTGCSGSGNEGTTAESGSSADTTAPASTDKTAINIGVLKGPTGMGAVNLIKAADDKTAQNDYTFTIAGAPDVLVSQLINGELDMAALPSNAAAVLYGKNQSVQVIAVNTLGVLYVLQKGDAVKSVEDLKGKTVYSAGKGSAADYVFNYILEKNGLVEGEDVTFDCSASEHSEVVAKAIAGEADIVLLPEPFVTSLTAKSADYSVALNVTDEWNKLGDAELPMGVIVANKEFAANNKEAVDAFITEYSASVESVKADAQAASRLIGEYEIMTAEVAVKAIPRCNMVCLTGVDMKNALSSYFNVLFEENPASVGGSLPADEFYYLPISVVGQVQGSDASESDTAWS